MVLSGVGGGQVVMRKAKLGEEDDIGLLEGLLQRSENYLIEFLCI